MGRRSGSIQTQTSSVCEGQMQGTIKGCQRECQWMSAGVIVSVSECLRRGQKDTVAALTSLNVESEFYESPACNFSYFILFGSHLSEMRFKAYSEASAPRRIRMNKVNLDLPQDFLTYSSITCISR